ncbi:MULTISPECIES: TetR/AcrR family transcriptional regulator [Actinomadura]|uniref:TetR/AcrR family transcriptional regulator n=1 Tax=Actinomadura TaxID=1988 RepID=UPI0004080B27|nr:TetR/AcrR family transcriptional regulator [Actinomadura madurae]URM96830.1 TetR/AcrR family transcriptional regulator [Actinomadura madurae]
MTARDRGVDVVTAEGSQAQGRSGGRAESRRGAAPRRKLLMSEIVDQAMRLFAERGYEGTTLQDVADAVGLSRPNLYNYVKSKEELLVAMVTATTESAVSSLREVRQRTDLDPTEKLRMLVRDLVMRRAEQPTQFRTLDRSEQALPREIAEKHLEGRRAVLHEVTAVIEEGVRAGRFRPVDARITALSIIGMCNWVAWWFHPSPGHPAEPVAEQIAANAVAMVVREAGRAPEAPPTPLGAVALLQQDIDHLTRLLGAQTGRGDVPPG